MKDIMESIMNHAGYKINENSKLSREIKISFPVNVKFDKKDVEDMMKNAPAGFTVEQLEKELKNIYLHAIEVATSKIYKEYT